MKYRIITNNIVYRIEQKSKWWPFWVLVRSYSEPIEFKYKVDAQTYVKSLIEINKKNKGPKWRVLSEE